MSCPIPIRFSRSLQESPAFSPDWRYCQVEEYLRCQRRALEAGETFVIPATERDSQVRSYFKFRTGLPTPKAAVCRYAHDCFETNERTSYMASRIKALTVAGMSSADIAVRLHTGVENIDAFQKLFFDVEVFVDDRAALGAILLPFTDESSATNSRERVWLLAALKLGETGLQYVMEGRRR